MPNNIYSPTITVARNKEGLDSGDEFDVLVSPSRSGVVSFSYDAAKTLFTIRCLDPDGMIMRKLGQWDISDWSSRYLSGESKTGVAASGSIWDQGVAVRIEDGIHPPAVAVSYLTGLTNFVDDKEQHMVELRLNARPYQIDRQSSSNIGGDYLGSRRRFNEGQVPVGTFTKGGGDFGTTVEFSLDFEKLVTGIEDLMAEPVRTENHEAVVILGDDTVAKLRSYYTNPPTKTGFGPTGPVETTLSFDRFLNEKLLFNYVERAEGPGEGSLYLMDSDTKVEADDALDAFIDRSGRGILYSTQRLQQVATSVGSVDLYQAVTLTAPDFVELYRDAFEGAFPEFNINSKCNGITIIGNYDLISSLSTTDAARGVNSRGGKAIAKIADKIADLYEQAFGNALDESVTEVFDGGFSIDFRANTPDSNVITMTHSQNHAVALSLIKDNIALKTMLEDEEPVSEGDIRKLVKQFLTLNLLDLPTMRALDEHLVEKGYIDTDREEIIDRFTKQLENYVSIQPGDRYSQAGLLSYLQYIVHRQYLGGNKLVVRTPPQFNLTGQQFMSIVSTMKHTLNKTTVTDKRDPVTGENPYSFLNGVYQILNIKHAATQNNAYSEFTIVQRPKSNNEPLPDVDRKEKVAEDVQLRDINRNSDGSIETLLGNTGLPELGIAPTSDQSFVIDLPEGTYRPGL